MGNQGQIKANIPYHLPWLIYDLQSVITEFILIFKNILFCIKVYKLSQVTMLW